MRSRVPGNFKLQTPNSKLQTTQERDRESFGVAEQGATFGCACSTKSLPRHPTFHFHFPPSASIFRALMSVAINILLAIHVVVSLFIVLIVLMQRPKNEGLGAAFGGGMTDNLFGAQTTNVLQTITRWLGGIFFLLTLVLSFLYVKQTAQKSEVQKRLSQAPPVVAATPSPDVPTATSPPVKVGDVPETPVPVPTPEAPKPADAKMPTEAPKPADVPKPADEKKPIEAPAPATPPPPAPVPAPPAADAAKPAGVPALPPALAPAPTPPSETPAPKPAEPEKPADKPQN